MKTFHVSFQDHTGRVLAHDIFTVADGDELDKIIEDEAHELGAARAVVTPQANTRLDRVLTHQEA